MLGPGVEASKKLRATTTVRFPKQVVPQTYFPQENQLPRDYSGTVRVGDDAPLGMRYWKMWTSQGGTPRHRFIIGDLPEVVEQGVPGDAIAEIVQLPVTANGRIYPREDVDIWSFDAKVGQQITCEVNAARLGSTLDAFLEVRDADGRRLGESAEHFGADPFLRFTASQDGTYHVRIHDVRFGGLQSSVYRLTVTAGSYIDTTYPLGGRRGEEVKLKLLGQAVPNERVQVALPADVASDYLHTFDCGDARHSVHLDVGDYVEALEAEPNHAPSQVDALEAPVVLNGRIEQLDDVDCWRLNAKKGETFQFEFRARRTGAPLNPLLIISDQAGKQLHRTEDLSQFTFPEDGTFCLTIQERFGRRGGPQFIYRMQISPPPKPDFRLRPAQQALSLLRGGAVEVTVNADRIGGFGGEIKLAVEDLPPEVTAEDATIPAGKNEIKFKLQAGPKTRVGVTPIRIRGIADLDGQSVARTASYQLGPGEAEIDAILLATGLSAPFKFKGKYEIPFALRGTTHYRRYQLDRGGFKGQLYVSLADQQLRHQWGSTGRTISLPPKTIEFDYPLQISTWTKVGLTGRTVVMLFGEVEDFDGSKHMVVFTSATAADQIMIQPSAGPLAIEAARDSIVARPHVPADVSVLIRRDPDLTLPVTLEVITGRHMRGIEATPVVVPAGENQGTLRIQFASDAGPFNMPLVIRAVARPTQGLTVRDRPLRKGDPIIAETRLSVVTDPGQNLSRTR
jgi:hypothetical protein